MRVCPTCAHENDQNLTFCDSCGEFLDWDATSGPVVSDRPGGSRFVPPRRRRPEPRRAASAGRAPAATAAAAAAAAASAAGRRRHRRRPPDPQPATPRPPTRTRPPARRPQRTAVAELPRRRHRHRPSRPSRSRSPTRRRPSGCAGWSPAARSSRHRSRKRLRRVEPVARVRAEPSARARARRAGVDHQGRRAGGAHGPVVQAARATARSIRRTGITVAVVGEFKKGKSTLVNALVNAEVCPADPVYASIAPISVGHGEEFTVTLTFGDGRTETVAARRRRRSPRSPAKRATTATTSASAASTSPSPAGCWRPGCTSSTCQASAGSTRRSARSTWPASTPPTASCSSPTARRS